MSSSSCYSFWRSKSTLSVLSTKSVKPESCWKRTGGTIGMVELTYIFLISVCWLLYFVLQVMFWSPGDRNWMLFLSHPSLCHIPMSAFQQPSEQGVPVTCIDHKTLKNHFHGTPHQQSGWNNGVCPDLLPAWKKGMSIQSSGLRGDYKGTR